MRRKQAPVSVLLLWLILASFLQESISSTTTMVQATRSAQCKKILRCRVWEDYHKLGPAGSGMKLASLVEQEKIHKRPSGPNPASNHHSPLRP